MISLLNKKIPSNVIAYVGLCKFYGISKKRSESILREIGVSTNISLENLSKNPRKWEKLSACLSDLLISTGENSIEKNLESFKASQINRLKNISSNRGQRMNRGYPSRGQRTRSNGKTAKKRLF